MKSVNKRGQVTIFIIIALAIVVLGILIYMFYPQIKSNLGAESKNPSAFLQECIEGKIIDTIEILSLQGGGINPEHYIIYDNSKIEYLCYTNEYYKLCVMQRPLLDNYIEEEIKREIEKEVQGCFEDLQKSFENRGYEVELKSGDFDVELNPGQIVVNFNHSLILIKETSEVYDSLMVVVNNNLYQLVSVATNILNWEAQVGDAETTLYMNAYHDLKVEKKKQTDGSTIYILTNRNTGDKFQFASRSVAWPPGFGTKE